jgi:hypothetical protein
MFKTFRAMDAVLVTMCGIGGEGVKATDDGLVAVQVRRKWGVIYAATTLRVCSD